MALGFHLLPQEFCRLASRHSGNLPDLTLPVRERHRAPDDAAALSSALSPTSVAVSTGRHDLSTARTQRLADAVDRRHGGWTKLDGDGPAILRGIRPDHAARRGRFFPAIHQMQFCTCRRKGSQATKRAIAGPQARLNPIQRINEIEGAESPLAGPENRKRVDCS